jgi:opacity protein-like surface antigen
MTKSRYLLACVFLLGFREVRAQESEVSVLVGAATSKADNILNGAVLSKKLIPTLQLGYARRLRTGAAELSLDVPLVLAVRTNGSVSAAQLNGTTGTDVYFTPGIRLHLTPRKRVSEYAYVGGGVASFTGTSVVTGTVSVAGNRANSAALGFGGGVSIRLLDRLSVRGEVRDAVTKSGLGGISGRNHAFVLGGFAFRF